MSVGQAYRDPLILVAAGGFPLAGYVHGLYGDRDRYQSQDQCHRAAVETPRKSGNALIGRARQPPGQGLQHDQSDKPHHSKTNQSHHGEISPRTEVGFDRVSGAVFLNRALREAGLLAVIDNYVGELLDPFRSRAFAVTGRPSDISSFIATRILFLSERRVHIVPPFRLVF